MYTCVKRNTDKYGNALSYVLKDSNGNFGEFNRETIKTMLMTKSHLIMNLKLSSDGKILYNLSNLNEKENYTITIHPIAVHSVLINKTVNDETFRKRFLNDVSIAACESIELANNTIRKYCSIVQNEITQDKYNTLHIDSKSIEVLGVYINRNGQISGYKIKNVGNKIVKYTEGVYSCYGRYDSLLHINGFSIKNINPGEIGVLNFIDAIRLICSDTYGGMWANTHLEYKGITRTVINPEEFMRAYRLKILGLPQLHEDLAGKKILSETIEFDSEVLESKSAANSVSLKDRLKRWLKNK